jgi:hypothetical protein
MDYEKCVVDTFDILSRTPTPTELLKVENSKKIK